jgi:hypothetical protein
VHDEYRIHAAVAPERVHDLVRALEAIDPVDELRAELGRLAVTHDDGDIYVYSDSLAAARSARSELQEAMTREGIEGEAQVARWHPLEERWEDAAAPLPDTPGQVGAERERRDAEEDVESADYGHPEWEVRITLPDREQAHELADHLESEGIPVVRRWHHLLVGANDEDEARALAERLRSEAPLGARLEVEGSGRYYWDLLNAPPGPFAIFGALPH